MPKKDTTQIVSPTVIERIVAKVEIWLRGELPQLTTDAARDIMRSVNSTLSEANIDLLLKGAMPHIDASLQHKELSSHIDKFIEELEKKEQGDIKTPKEMAGITLAHCQEWIKELVPRIIKNYYRYAPDIETLRSDSSVIGKYQIYFNRVIFKRYKSLLPKDYSVEDFLNDVWVNVLASLDTFHFRSSFTTWCFLVIRSTWRDHCKKSKEHLTVSFGDRVIDGENKATETINICDPKATEMFRVIDDQKSQIDKALKQSRDPEKKRKLFMMLNEGVEPQTIAKSLNISPNTVYIVRHRLKKKSLE